MPTDGASIIATGVPGVIDPPIAGATWLDGSSVPRNWL